MSSYRLLKLKVRPHPGQLEVIRSDTFCTAAIAGTGGGKTVNGYVKLLTWMAQNPGQIWVAAEPTQDMVERILWTSSAGRMSHIDFMSKFDPNQVFLKSKGILRHRLGTVFYVSADRPEALQGAHVAGVWLDEGGLMKRDVFLVALQRVGFEGGRLLITTTPYNMGWLKRDVYDRWREGDKDYKVVQFASTANPKFPKEAMERAKRVMSPTRYRMMYEGGFGRPEGMIYDCWDDGMIIEPFKIPDSWDRFDGMDFGYNNPTAVVFLARDSDGVYYLYDEHYQREKTLAHHAGVLTLKGGQRHGLWGDPSAKQQIAELGQMGISVRAANNDVKAGIDTVYEVMAGGRLKVFQSCKWFLDEVEGYVWKKGDAEFKDEPVKENDHLMDALRYAIHSVERGSKLSLYT